MNKVVKIVIYPVLILAFLSVFSIFKHTEELSANELSDVKSALEIEERLAQQSETSNSVQHVNNFDFDEDEFELVQLEDSGDHVRELQSLLNLDADGIFGVSTYEKVKEIQAKHNLKVDGVVGSETWKVINQVNREITFVD